MARSPSIPSPLWRATIREITIGKITSRDVKARPLATPIADSLAMLGAMKPETKPTPAQVRQIGSFLIDLADSVAIGLVEVRDIQIKTKSAPQPVTIKVARAALSRFGERKVGEITYEGFDVAATDGSAKIGSIALRDFDASSAAQTAKTALATPGDGDLFAGVEPRALIPTLGQIAVSNVDMDVPDLKGEGNALGGKRIQFSIGRADLTSSNVIQGLPTAFGMSVDHAVMDFKNAAPGGQMKDLLDAGYSKLDLSAKIAANWTESSKELALKEVSLVLADMGSVKTGLLFGNVPRELFSTDPNVMQAALLTAVVKRLDLAIVNEGFIEKMLALQAKKSGTTAETLKQQAIMGAAVGLPAILGTTAGAKTLAAALAKFIAAPKNLTISMVAPLGLGAADMGLINNPPALFEMIEVTAEANK